MRSETDQVFLCLYAHNQKKIDDNTGINPGGKLYYQSIKKSHYAILKFKSLISLDSLESKKRRLKRYVYVCYDRKYKVKHFS